MVFVGSEVLGETSVGGRGTGRIGVVPPSPEPVFHGFGSDISTRLEAHRIPRDDEGSIPDPPVPDIALYFYEAAGQGWLRLSDGHLSEGEAKPANRWGA